MNMSAVVKRATGRAEREPGSGVTGAERSAGHDACRAPQSVQRSELYSSVAWEKGRSGRLPTALLLAPQKVSRPLSLVSFTRGLRGAFVAVRDHDIGFEVEGFRQLVNDRAVGELAELRHEVPVHQLAATLLE